MKKYKLACKQCGRTFDGKLARGQYCSGRCMQATYNARKRAARKVKAEATSLPQVGRDVWDLND